ncbi:hypothetical protein LGR54_11240 [Ancylobacter sp. Lp-2]|nr:hypothetical protein [Ancylobacter sp. Lp-2]
MALLAGGAASASEQTAHDGVWKVQTSVEDGRCGTNYGFKLSVKKGRVTYAGMWPVKATGDIRPGGRIAMDIAHGGQHVLATGLVRGEHASGEWKTPKPACSGAWVASRQS